MKNTKKIVALIMCITMLLSMVIPLNKVFAAPVVSGNKVYSAFTVTSETSPVDAKVKQTKSLLITYKINFDSAINWPNIPGTSSKMGINVIRGVIEYDPNVFETIKIVKNSTDEDGAPVKYSLDYTDENGMPIVGTGAWNTELKVNPYYDNEEDAVQVDEANANNGKVKFVVQTKAGYTRENGNFLQLLLVVKPQADTTKSTTVKMTNIEAGNTLYDYYVANSAETIPTAGPQTAVTPTPLVEDPVPPVIPDPEGKMMGYIRMAGNTKLNAFKKSVAGEAIYSPYTTFKTLYTNGVDLKDSDYIPTGAIATNGKELSSADFRYCVFIMVGDINADGRVSATDLSQTQALLIRTDILGDDTGSNTYKLDANKNEDWGKNQNNNRRRAADIKWDEKLLASDVSNAQMQLINYRQPETAGLGSTDPRRCVPVVGR